MASIFYTPNKPTKRSHSQYTAGTATNQNHTVSDKSISKHDQFYSVHRCRFIEFNPLNYTVLDIATNQLNTLCAVLRSNNSIELYTINQSYYKYATIYNPFDQQYINRIIWCRNRLFCCTSNSRLIEYNFCTLAIQHVTDTYSAAHSIDVCLNYNNNNQQIIGVGCADGSIRLFDVTDTHEPAIYLRSIQAHTINTRVNSVQFNTYDNICLVSANDLGEIKLINTLNNVTQTSITTSSKHSKSYRVSIHTCRFVSNSVVVCGNSNGIVQLYDVKFGTLMNEYITHTADVMSIATVPQHHTFYSSSIDGCIIEYKLINNQYIQTVTQKQHTHDILSVAVAVHPDSTYDIISGGIDTMLHIHTVKPNTKQLFTVKQSIKLFPLPYNTIHNAQHQSNTMLLSHTECKLQLYSLGHTDTTAPNNQSMLHDRQTLQLQQSYNHLLDINTNLDYIVSSAISSNARYIAVSGMQRIKLYELSIGDTDSGLCVDTKRIKSNQFNQFGANQLQFTRDNQYVIIGALDSTVYCYDIMNNVMTPLGVSLQDHIITHITQSTSSTYIAVASVDIELQHTIAVYRNNQPYWNIPNNNSMISTALTYQSDNILIVSYTNHSIVCYNMSDQCITEWSKHNAMPHRLLNQSDHIVHITVDQQNIILQSHTYMCYINLDQPLLIPSDHTTNNRNKHPNGRIITRYRPLMHAEFTGSENTLVVVEIGWLNVLQQLPNPLQVKKYGT